MTNTPRLGKSNIEYLTHAWNFYSGCCHSRDVCPVSDNCWARKLVARFPEHYPNKFQPTFYPEAFLSPLHLKKPARIGVCFMGDLFGDWVNPDMKTESMLPSGIASIGMSLKGWIFTTIRQCPQHTFVFLTKNPAGMLPWSPFPENCWMGATATDSIMFAAAYYHLANIEARVKYISIEPLLDWDERVTKAVIHQAAQAGVNWIIIGSQTKPYKPPKVEWVEDIVMECIKAGIPIWLKDNLVDALPPTIPFYVPPLETPAKGEIKMAFRQEIPK